MPGRSNLFEPHCYYHIYNRGNNRQRIFFQSANYQYFMQGINKYLLPLMDIVAYCLMPTHYHLLIRIKETSVNFKSLEVSHSMQKFIISYTKAINKRFNRVGALFQGAYKAKLIIEDNHLIHLCRYIHANPVIDGLVMDPGDWTYSNYLEWVGLRNSHFVDQVFIQDHFDDRSAYRDFVSDYIKAKQA